MAVTKTKQQTTHGSDARAAVVRINELATLTAELATDHATFKTVVDDLKTLVNNLRNTLNYQALGNPGLQRVSNFDVNNANAISYVNGGTLKTFAGTTTFDTGTSKTITGSNYGAFLCTISAAGSAVVTWASGGGYASEALAIAALTLPDATSTPIGYVTVQAHASGFTAGTDALTGGTGGNVATATTYYNLINPNALLFGAAVSSSAPATLTATAIDSIGSPAGTAYDDL